MQNQGIVGQEGIDISFWDFYSIIEAKCKTPKEMSMAGGSEGVEGELEEKVSNSTKNESENPEEKVCQEFLSLHSPSSDTSVTYAGHSAAWQQASWLDLQQLGSRQLGRSGPQRQQQFIIWKEVASRSFRLGDDGSGTWQQANEHLGTWQKNWHITGT